MSTRRDFLTTGVAAVTAACVPATWATAQDSAQVPDLARQIGITMSSVARLKNDRGPLKHTMFDWIKIIRDELDMRVLDLNSGVLESLEPEHLDRVRAAADRSGVWLTNMKINRPDVDIGNADPAVRQEAVAECRRWIDASAQLGLRWARPLPLKQRPDMPGYIAAYRELADYAGERQVQMLVENYGWMAADADAAPQLLDAVGRNIAACPDTGNWESPELRAAGLKAMFPRAASCDFKAGKLGPAGEHPSYDLKECFLIGWGAGFRGPWCLEHAHEDRDTLFRELGLLRDMLRGWMVEQS